MRLSTGYLKAVWPEFYRSVLGVWAAPGGVKTIQKCGGRSPLHFWMVLKPPGAAQTTKTDPTNPARLPSGTQLGPIGLFWRLLALLAGAQAIGAKKAATRSACGSHRAPRPRIRDRHLVEGVHFVYIYVYFFIFLFKHVFLLREYIDQRHPAFA